MKLVSDTNGHHDQWHVQSNIYDILKVYVTQDQFYPGVAVNP